MTDREMLTVERDWLRVGEILDFSWRPSAVPADGDTIASASAVVAGAVEDSTTWDDTTVTTMLRDLDQAAAVVVVEWTVVTSSGRRHVGELRIEGRT